MAVAEGETKLESLDDVVTEAARTEILHTDGSAVGVVLKDIVIVFRDPFVQYEHRFPLALLLPFLACLLSFLYLYMIFLRQPSESLDVCHLLVLHDESYWRAALSAREAVAVVARRGDRERRCGVVVERTQSLVVHACLTQRHKLRHHIDNVSRCENAFDGGTVYHLHLYYKGMTTGCYTP